MLMKLGMAAVAALSLSTGAFADYIHDDIYRLAETIKNEVYSSSADDLSLRQAQSNLRAALDSIRTRGGGGGGGVDGLYCQRVADTTYYAPARSSDRGWLQDFGTDLQQCQNQLRSARNGLICIRVRDTTWYAPMLSRDRIWRGEHGTDYVTCERQVVYSRYDMFCQRVRDTAYFAAARTQTGEWLQANGTSLDECLRSIGNLGANAKVFQSVTIPE